MEKSIRSKQPDILEAALRKVWCMLEQIYIGSLKKYVREMVWLGEKGVYIVGDVLNLRIHHLSEYRRMPVLSSLLGVNEERE